MLRVDSPADFAQSALGRTLAEKTGKISERKKREFLIRKAKEEVWVRERAPGRLPAPTAPLQSVIRTGDFSAGPGTYKIPDSVGKQALSTIKNAGSVCT